MISSFIPSFLLGWGKRGLEQDPFQSLCLWFLQQWPAPGQSVNRRAIETASWCWHPCKTTVRPCQTGQDVGKMLGSFVPTRRAVRVIWKSCWLGSSDPGQVDVTFPSCEMARRESCKTLVCLLQALEGSSTTVELRNEITVQGTIHHVDYRMKWDLI